MPKRLVIAAGGTGGHLLPAQALAQQLRRRDQQLEICFAGAGLERSAWFSSKEWDYVEIPSASMGWRGIFSILKGVLKALRLLTQKRPNLIVGFGSYHTFPVLVAARILRIPLLLHEGNSIPGKVNRAFARYAELVALHLPCAAPYVRGRSVVSGMPLRDGYLSTQINKRAARIDLGLDPDTFTFLVFGGSQGAEALNHLFSRAILDHLAKGSKRYQIIHLTGHAATAAAYREEYDAEGIANYVRGYEKKMDRVWAAADLLVSRSGASTIAEELELEVPGILVPYPYAADAHQNGNADHMVNEVKGAVKFYETELNSKKLADAIRDLVSGQQLKKMQSNMQRYKKEHPKRDLCTLVAEQMGLEER